MLALVQTLARFQTDIVYTYSIGIPVGTPQSLGPRNPQVPSRPAGAGIAEYGPPSPLPTTTTAGMPGRETAGPARHGGERGRRRRGPEEREARTPGCRDVDLGVAAAVVVRVRVRVCERVDAYVVIQPDGVRVGAHVGADSKPQP